MFFAKQIGRLNLLTPSRVKAAADEIKTGEIVPLKYAIARFRIRFIFNFSNGKN